MATWTIDWHMHLTVAQVTAATCVAPPVGYAVGYGAGSVARLLYPHIKEGWDRAFGKGRPKLNAGTLMHQTVATAIALFLGAHTAAEIKGMPHGVVQAELEHTTRSLDPKFDISSVNFSDITTGIKVTAATMKTQA